MSDSCNSMDHSPPGSSVHGILQTRILEWVAMLSSRGSSWPRDRTCISCIFCFAGEFFTAEPLGKPLLDLRRISFSISLWSINMMLAIDFNVDALDKVDKSSSFSENIFYHYVCWILSSAFFKSIDMIMWFFFFNLLI